ncbi:20775_t:CDS:2, partial [Dentiscutata erythropus]
TEGEEIIHLGVDLPVIKPFTGTTRSKKPVKNPEPRLVRFRYKNQENLMITEVLETYYDPGVPEKEGLKQEKNAESGLEIDLINLIDSYLETVDTWISELKSENEEKTDYNLGMDIPVILTQEKVKEARNKDSTPDKLLQESLTIYEAPFGKIVQEKEETPKRMPF